MNVFQEVRKAEGRIGRYVRKTPLEYSPYLSKLCGCNAYLKLESGQLTGSFKIRGAFNKFLSSKGELKNGFVTASTGNHGRAVAYVAKTLGIRGSVYVPKNVARAKLEALRLYGIRIRQHRGLPVETEIHARKVAERLGVPFISPYNDLKIVAGQGTIGYEIFEQLPSVDVVLVCIGGGGLISGIAGYLKGKNSKIRIIGCEPKNSCTMYESIRAGKIVTIAHKPTLSDGSAGGIEPGSITFGFCRKYVDDYVTVTESEIRNAMRYMIDKHHKIIEGAAAVPLASLLKMRHRLRNKNVVVVLSGSNVGIETIRKVVS